MNKICQVMEAFTAKFVRAFEVAAAAKPKAKATSISRILKSEEICTKWRHYGEEQIIKSTH